MTVSAPTAPSSKAELIDALRSLQRIISFTIAEIPRIDYQRPIGDNLWSPEGYFKHLILSVKPFVRVLEKKPDGARRLFGVADHPSISYEELVVLYQKKIDEGVVRAEAAPAVMPDTFRFPDDVTDKQGYLLRTWNDAGDRLITALDAWDESELDTMQVPHPAIGMLTIREMLFFTLHHNLTHLHDIRRGYKRDP